MELKPHNDQKPPEEIETLNNMLNLVRPRIAELQAKKFLEKRERESLEDLLRKQKDAVEQIKKLEKNKI